MYDEAQEKTDRYVIERVCKSVPINAGQAGFVHFEKANAHDRKNQNRLKRHTDLPLNVEPFRSPFLDLAFFFFLVLSNEVHVIGMPARHKVAQD